MRLRKWARAHLWRNDDHKERHDRAKKSIWPSEQPWRRRRAPFETCHGLRWLVGRQCFSGVTVSAVFDRLWGWRGCPSTTWTLPDSDVVAVDRRITARVLGASGTQKIRGRFRHSESSSSGQVGIYVRMLDLHYLPHSVFEVCEIRGLENKASRPSSVSTAARRCLSVSPFCGACRRRAAQLGRLKLLRSGHGPKAGRFSAQAIRWLVWVRRDQHELSGSDRIQFIVVLSKHVTAYDAGYVL